MQTVLSKLAVLLLLLILINGVSNISTLEARSQKHRSSEVPKQNKIDCTSDEHCNPFSPKIDIACKDSGDCQTRCNDFDGIFTCYDKDAYCKCLLDS
ncbi:hypothetical protein RND81_07G172600 [Saponaria officinalis]|uniref:Uncharacterized protein n=1 Tax=Saponaria officinalis TaxID=3572 RepID=A0AAW1JRB3_SAPOF